MEVDVNIMLSINEMNQIQHIKMGCWVHHMYYHELTSPILSHSMLYGILNYNLMKFLTIFSKKKKVLRLIYSIKCPVEQPYKKVEDKRIIQFHFKTEACSRVYYKMQVNIVTQIATPKTIGLYFPTTIGSYHWENKIRGNME